jgi:hypothetical protein
LDSNELNGGQLAYFSPENDEEDAAFMQEAFAMKDDEAWSSDKMTAKVPPAYDGLSSFFAYEEYVEEWLLITTIEPDKQAPLLRFRLKGNALTVKRLLNQERLKGAGAVKYSWIHYDHSLLKIEAMFFYGDSCACSSLHEETQTSRCGYQGIR